MPRYIQKRGTKGSLKWIQRLVNDHPQILACELKHLLPKNTDADVEWLSPLRTDAYAEYRDAAFLNRLGLKNLADDLAKFWPRGGPQWDALGRLSDGTVLLVEAKAHVSEVLSNCQAKAQESQAQIQKSLARVRRELAVKTKHDWLSPFYQYANRIAHLHFLANMHGEKTRLLFVDFVGDTAVKGPTTAEEWHGVTELMHAYLGVGRTKLSRCVHHVVVDVMDLE